MSLSNHRTVLTTALFLVASTGGALAEEADKERKLQPVYVNGIYLQSDEVNSLKAPTPIIDVPQSLSIITADDIALRGFNSIGDIITYTPGVNSSQGEGHRDAIVFRGVRSTADFFVDGVRDDVEYYRPLYNLEQIEILRGPNALLFGRGGTGGILNRVTKKAEIGEQFTGYSAGIDTFGAFDVAIDSNFEINDKAAFRINAFYESLENHRDLYDGDRYGINPTAQFALSPVTTLDLSYEYANHERFIDRGIPTNDLASGNFEPVEAFEDIVFGDPELNTTEFEAHILRANLQHRFSDTLKGNFTAAYGDYDKLYQNFYASDLVDINTVQLDGYVDTTQRKRFTLAGNLVGEFQTGSIGHTLIAGAEFLDTSNDNDRLNPEFDTAVAFNDIVLNDGNPLTDRFAQPTDRENFVIGRPLPFSGGTGTSLVRDPVTGLLTSATQTTTMTFTDVIDDNEAEVSVMSFYVQDQIEINQYVDILLGARFDRFEIDVDDIANGVSRSRTDEEISPRAGLIIKPQENLSLYGSYSESFLPRSGGQYASLSDSTERLDPDVFEQAEIGVKWDFLDNLSFTAAYFQNEQTRTQRDQNDETFEQRGLEVDGFELQLQGNITDNWFVTAGYSYLSGETASGADPRELPENTFSIWNAVEVTDRFGFGIGATYQDDTRISDGTGQGPMLPAYTRVDASAYYLLNNDIRLQLNIENLTDETYFPASHSTHQATVGAPLNARFSITGKF